MAIEKVYGAILAGERSIDCKEYGFIGRNVREVKKRAEKFAAKMRITHNGKVWVVVESWKEPLEKGFVKILEEHRAMEEIINYTGKDVEFGDGIVAVPEEIGEATGKYLYKK